MPRWFPPLLVLWPGLALAEPLNVYDGPISFRAEAQSFELPLALTAEPVDADTLQLAATIGLQPVLPAANAALKAQIAGFPSSCEHRLSLGATSVAVAVEGAEAAISVALSYELWACQRVLGKQIKTKILTESGTVRAWAAPVIDGGRLQLRLTRFQVDDLSEVSKALNVEEEIRQKVQGEIDALNRDPDFAELPKPLQDEGFAYASVALSSAAGPRLTLSITGPDRALPFFRIWTALQAGAL